MVDCNLQEQGGFQTRLHTLALFLSVKVYQVHSSKQYFSLNWKSGFPPLNELLPSCCSLTGSANSVAKDTSTNPHMQKQKLSIHLTSLTTLSSLYSHVCAEDGPKKTGKDAPQIPEGSESTGQSAARGNHQPPLRRQP